MKEYDHMAKLRSARSEIAHSPSTAFEQGTLCSVPNTPHEITAPEILFWMEGWSNLVCGYGASRQSQHDHLDSGQLRGHCRGQCRGRCRGQCKSSCESGRCRFLNCSALSACI